MILHNLKEIDTPGHHNPVRVACVRLERANAILQAPSPHGPQRLIESTQATPPLRMVKGSSLFSHLPVTHTQLQESRAYLFSVVTLQYAGRFHLKRRMLAAATRLIHEVGIIHLLHFPMTKRSQLPCILRREGFRSRSSSHRRIPWTTVRMELTHTPARTHSMWETTLFHRLLKRFIGVSYEGSTPLGASPSLHSVRQSC